MIFTMNGTKNAVSTWSYESICEKSSYTVSVDDPLGYDTQEMFLHGFCTIFAFCYAGLYGSSAFLVITDKFNTSERWKGHILVADNHDKDLWIDVNGSQTMQSIGNEYPSSQYSYKIVGKDEALATTVHESLFDDPMMDLGSFEKRFVEIVVREVYSRKVDHSQI